MAKTSMNCIFIWSSKINEAKQSPKIKTEYYTYKLISQTIAQIQVQIYGRKVKIPAFKPSFPS